MPQTYHLHNIRKLLIEGFSGEELRRLCHDVSELRQASLNKGMFCGIIRIILL